MTFKSVLFAAAFAALATTASAQKAPAPAAPQPSAPSAADWRTPNADDVLVIDTNKGRIIVELVPEVAPLCTTGIPSSGSSTTSWPRPATRRPGALAARPSPT